MHWGRAAVVAATLVTSSFVTAPHTDAAPLSGMHFVQPSRAFDQFNVPSGKLVINTGGGVPFAATQALVRITLDARTAGSTGAVMAHDCAVPANPDTDVVLPIDTAPVPLTNDVYVPVSSGNFCITTTAIAPRLIVDLEGYVSAPGSSYVDIPFQFVQTIVGPVSDLRVDLSPAGLPADANGVALWLDASSSSAGFATLYPCGSPRPLASQALWGADIPTSTLVAGVLMAPATGLCIFILDGATVDISIDGYYSPTATPSSTSPPQIRYAQDHAPGFISTTPTRLFDTRDSGAPIAAGGVHRLDVSTLVPPEATSVVMNVTATQPQGAGFVTVYPCDGDRPVASNLNVTAGLTVPNLVTVDVGSTQEVCFFASTTTHLLADLAGYYLIAGGDGFVPSTVPVRMFDTRNTAKIGTGATFAFDLTPYVAADATSAVFNLTATDVEGNGFVTAFPCGGGRPLASNLNVTSGQTVPNLVTVALPADKRVCFFTSSRLDLIADVAGWYSPSSTSGFISTTPIRWVDTRLESNNPVPGGVSTVDFGTEIPDATAVVLNATVVEPVLPGFLTAYPCSPQPPLASNVNFVAAQVVPNMVISALDGNGELCVLNNVATQWILDLSGYFTDSLFYFGFFPDGSDVL